VLPAHGFAAVLPSSVLNGGRDGTKTSNARTEDRLRDGVRLEEGSDGLRF
jgi:hypothetical protein